MGKHLTTRRNPMKDPWVVVVIIAEIAAVCFLLVTIPALQNDAESLAKLFTFLLELIKLAAIHAGP